MVFYGINGSPRKRCSTAKLLNESLKGIESVNSSFKTELINLYSLDYKGCKSCFSCKKINGKSYGKCSIKDDLKPILKKLVKADGIILGSPIYFGDISGGLKSFLERFAFPYFVYDKKQTSLAPKRFPLAIFYTMNIKKQQAIEYNYNITFSNIENYLENIFTKPYSLKAYNTYQFKDYSKYESSLFNVKDKENSLKMSFPKDCKKAFKIGIKIAKDSDLFK